MQKTLRNVSIIKISNIDKAFNDNQLKTNDVC